MAVYEYRCTKCGKQFEILRNMSQADDPAGCPKCKGKGQRLISVFASNQDSTLQVPTKAPLRARTQKRAKADKTRRGTRRG